MTTLFPHNLKKGNRVRLVRVATEEMVHDTGFSLAVNQEFQKFGLKVSPEFGSEGKVIEVFADGYVAVIFDDYPPKVSSRRASRTKKTVSRKAPRTKKGIKEDEYPLHFPAGCFDKVL